MHTQHHPHLWVQGGSTAAFLALIHFDVRRSRFIFRMRNAYPRYARIHVPIIITRMSSGRIVSPTRCKTGSHRARGRLVQFGIVLFEPCASVSPGPGETLGGWSQAGDRPRSLWKRGSLFRNACKGLEASMGLLGFCNCTQYICPRNGQRASQRWRRVSNT